MRVHHPRRHARCCRRQGRLDARRDHRVRRRPHLGPARWTTGKTTLRGDVVRAIVRQFRRAPGRILASVFALALAVGRDRRARGAERRLVVALRRGRARRARRHRRRHDAARSAPTRRDHTTRQRRRSRSAGVGPRRVGTANGFVSIGLATDRTMDLIDIADGSGCRSADRGRVPEGSRRGRRFDRDRRARRSRWSASARRSGGPTAACCTATSMRWSR